MCVCVFLGIKLEDSHGHGSVLIRPSISSRMEKTKDEKKGKKNRTDPICPIYADACAQFQ